MDAVHAEWLPVHNGVASCVSLAVGRPHHITESSSQSSRACMMMGLVQKVATVCPQANQVRGVACHADTTNADTTTRCMAGCEAEWIHHADVAISRRDDMVWCDGATRRRVDTEICQERWRHNQQNARFLRFVSAVVRTECSDK
eukprot:scaffold13680_cov62-Phaeocystis_antarctica.AAC.1